MPAKFDIENGEIVFGKVSVRKVFEELEDGTYWLSDPEEWNEDMTWRQIKFVKGVLRKVYANEMGYGIKEAERELKKEFGEVQHCQIQGQPCIELISFGDPVYDKFRMAEFITDVLHHFEFDCGIIIDPKIRKQYKIDELTGELKEVG